MKFSALSASIILAFPGLSVLAIPAADSGSDDPRPATIGSVQQAQAASICGDFALPKSIPKGDLRLCADHPGGRDRLLEESQGASLVPWGEGEGGDDGDAEKNNAALPPNTIPLPSTGLDKRRCYNAAPYGCPRGHCWKACGNKNQQAKGQWCGTAKLGGLGGWRTCSKWQDCGTNDWTYGCGKKCLFSCGCGC